MPDVVNLQKRITNVDVTPEFKGVSKLICNVSDEEQITVGDDSGYTIEFDNPQMNRETLGVMLESIRGYQYQPYTATGALLDPAAEIGDGVNANGVFSSIFTRERIFSRLMKADISAPADEEIDHEYKYESKQERKVRRELGDVRATLLIQADRITAEVEQREDNYNELRSQLTISATEIAARVTKTGGDASSFGWSLLSDEFGLFSGNKKVFYVNATGAHVDGEITANSGQIGGFTITSKTLSNWNDGRGVWLSSQPWSGSGVANNAVMQVGSNFYVYNNGSIRATGGEIAGFTIKSNGISKWESDELVDQNGITLSPTQGIRLGYKNGDYVFSVSSSGAVRASNLAIYGGSISIGDNFRVTSQGNLTANRATLSGGEIAGFTINNTGISKWERNDLSDQSGITLSTTQGIRLGYKDNQYAFSVGTDGAVRATNLTITGGSIRIGNDFIVTPEGNVTANNMVLKGTLKVYDENGVDYSRISSQRLRDGANAGYSWSNGGYQGYDSRAAYAISGAGSGISASNTWRVAQDPYGGVDYVKARTINAADTFIYKESGIQFKWVNEWNCFVLVSYGEG